MFGVFLTGTERSFFVGVYIFYNESIERTVPDWLIFSILLGCYKLCAVLGEKKRSYNQIKSCKKESKFENVSMIKVPIGSYMN